MMEKDIVDIFADKLKEELGEKFNIRSEIDSKGVVCGWCKLNNASDITKVAEIISELDGRIMTISAVNTPDIEKQGSVEINYHFYFKKINCTVSIVLTNGSREVKSITPILKSADWHEREMQEFYKIKLIGHPNPRELFLDKNTQVDVNTMVPLSSAMNGASTSTLWEKVMKSSGREVRQNE